MLLSQARLLDSPIPLANWVTWAPSKHAAAVIVERFVVRRVQVLALFQVIDELSLGTLVVDSPVSLRDRHTRAPGKHSAAVIVEGLIVRRV